MTRFAIIREEVLQVTYPDETSARADMAMMQESESVKGGLRVHFRVEPQDRMCRTCKHLTARPIYVDFEGHGPESDEEGCMVEDRMDDRAWELSLLGMCPMWEQAEDEEITEEDFGVTEGDA